MSKHLTVKLFNAFFFDDTEFYCYNFKIKNYAYRFYLLWDDLKDPRFINSPKFYYFDIRRGVLNDLFSRNITDFNSFIGKHITIGIRKLQYAKYHERNFLTIIK